MRPAPLVVSIALAFITAASCFSQQAAQSGEREAEAVVVRLYKQVVFRKPLGVSWKKADRKAIWPLLSHNLIEHIKVAEECEKDYDRQHHDPNLKAPFAWLENGLFSGGNEQAEPSRFGVRTVKQEDASDQ